MAITVMMMPMSLRSVNPNQLGLLPGTSSHRLRWLSHSGGIGSVAVGQYMTGVYSQPIGRFRLISWSSVVAKSVIGSAGALLGSAVASGEGIGVAVAGWLAWLVATSTS